MKIEVRCDGCGRGYMVDEAKIPPSGGLVPCQTCGAIIELKAPRPISRPPAPKPDAPAPQRASEVCCPRCRFHFVPDAKAAPKPAGRPTVLVVEDMDYFIEIAREALGARYELKIARTIDEARAALSFGGIDLMLLDMTLEQGEDGLQLLQGDPGKTCPVLLFTAQDESEMYGENWDKLRAQGVDDVVFKGMNMDEALTRKVAEMLGEPVATDSFRR